MLVDSNIGARLPQFGSCSVILLWRPSVIISLTFWVRIKCVFLPPGVVYLAASQLEWALPPSGSSCCWFTVLSCTHFSPKVAISVTKYQVTLVILYLFILVSNHVQCSLFIMIFSFTLCFTSVCCLYYMYYYTVLRTCT